MQSKRPAAPLRVLCGLLLLGAVFAASPGAWAAPATGLYPVTSPAASPAISPAASASAAVPDSRLRDIIARAQAEPQAPPSAVTQPAEDAQATPRSWWGAPQVVHEVSSRASDLVVNALSFLGVRYRYGGDHASSGVDCSGLVRRVYQETLGLVLPHNAAEQSREGEKVAENELRPGDLVFFNTLRRAFSHVGIYIGNGQFVHAPRRGEKVQIANLDSPYWKRRFDGARRLIRSATNPLVPSAQAASPESRPPQALPAAALPLSNAVPADASPETAALMAGAVLPRPLAEGTSR